MLLCCISCSKDVRLKASAIEDRSTTPVLDAGQVTTLISDSGITRYRISAGTWQIYDQSRPTYWEFVDGIYLEKFDENLNIEASLRSDYAIYYDESQQWTLTGHVKAVNEAGEEFDTPMLIWDQKAEQVYSDSAITIKRATSVIQGVGFRSNQTMSQYTILQPTGFFPIEEE